jgi:hypothetical protein
MKTKKPKVKILHIPTGVVFEVPNYLSFCGLFSKNLNEMNFHTWRTKGTLNHNISYSTFTRVRKLIEILYFSKIVPNDVDGTYIGALIRIRKENTIECFEILYD